MPRRHMKPHNKEWTLEELDSLAPWPLYASTKYNGIRGSVQDNLVVSNSGKPIRNTFVQELFSEFEGLDSEIILDSPVAPDVRPKSQGFCNSNYREGNVHFYVFDSLSIKAQYIDRLAEIQHYNSDLITIVPQTLVHSIDDIVTLQHEALEAGYEGLVLRSPNGVYRNGRCSWKQLTSPAGSMLKFKQFDELEAQVIDFKPLKRNMNMAEAGPLGLTERSTSKAGLIEDHTMLGAFKVTPLPKANHNFTEPFWVGGAIAGLWDETERRRLMTVAQFAVDTKWSMTLRFLPEGHETRPQQPKFVAWVGTSKLRSF